MSSVCSSDQPHFTFSFGGRERLQRRHIFVPISFSSPCASLTVTFMETNKNKRKYISDLWNSSTSDVNAGMWPWTHQRNLSAVIHSIELTDLFRKITNAGQHISETFLLQVKRTHLSKGWKDPEQAHLLQINRKQFWMIDFLVLQNVTFLKKMVLFFVISIVDISEIRVHVHWSLWLPLLKMKQF